MAKRKALGGITVTRLLPNICTDKMAETRDFYKELLGFVVGFEHKGWYIQRAGTSRWRHRRIRNFKSALCGSATSSRHELSSIQHKGSSSPRRSKMLRLRMRL